jgi:UDP-glucose 4-epimerase
MCKDRPVSTHSYVIVGGAGFIGSHFVDTLLARAGTTRVTAFDNFSSGRKWHVEHHRDDRRFELVEGDVREPERLLEAMHGHDVVIHLASNPDIARAVTEPAIDFDAGTLLTHHVIEAARQAGISEILYASGSGVYGEIGEVEAHEDYGPLVPVSTYAASKLAGEALLSAYCHMFGIRGRSFRFGNVVGPRQTHGVGFDFVKRLRAEPHHLKILGDGRQSKSYVDVDDIIRAVLLAHDHETAVYQVYNVATGDYITVTEIAELAVGCLGLSPDAVAFEYTGGDRGWNGDVPIVRLSSDRIRALGWECRYPAAEALRRAIISMIEDDAAGRL